jgi:ABC-type multidrug transport system fused ATPase/permease subunit
MSKMEYLQNKEFANEQKRIYKHLDDICTENYTIDTSVGGMFIGLRGISFFLRISVYILVGLGIYSSTATYYDFSLYTLIVGMLELTLRTVYDTFRKFTREFDYIQNFWSTFDSLSPIHGYDTGSTYTPQNTDIHIDHIRYGYGGEYVFDDLSLSIYR